MKIACIDIGGTSIKRLCATAEKGMKLADYRVEGFDSAPTRAAEGFEAIRSAVFDSISSLIDTYGCEAIAISTAGTVDWDRGVVTFATAALPGFTGYDIVSDVKAKFGLPVRAINDATAAAVAEHYIDKFSRQSEVVLTIGTGLGSALIRPGKLCAESVTDLHIGHVCFDEEGVPCKCGKRGCIEQYASASALRRMSGEDDLDKVFNDYCSYPTAIETFIKALVKAVKLAFETGVKRVVVGGGVAEIKGWWGGFLGKFPYEMSSRIGRAQLGNRAGALGAAYAALNGQFKNQ